MRYLFDNDYDPDTTPQMQWLEDSLRDIFVDFFQAWAKVFRHLGRLIRWLADR